MGVVIIGFPRSGKTTLGRQLAQEMNRPFYDTDEAIERSVGMSPRAHMKRVGSRQFREDEAQALEQAPPGSVVATGGGVVLNKRSCATLHRFDRVIFLQVPLEVVQARLRENPLPAECGDFEQIYAERLPLYLQHATEIWDGQ